MDEHGCFLKFTLFCYDLRFLAWRKLSTKIVYVEKNYKYEVWDEGGQRWLKVDENIRGTRCISDAFCNVGTLHFVNKK